MVKKIVSLFVVASIVSLHAAELTPDEALKREEWLTRTFSNMRRVTDDLYVTKGEKGEDVYYQEVPVPQHKGQVYHQRFERVVNLTPEQKADIEAALKQS